MSIAVIGGTGTVGSETVRQLVTRGERVRVLTRSKEKFASLPKGAEGCVADLEKPESLRTALTGSERLFLITPLSEMEAEEGIAAVEAAKAAGIRRIVFMSIHNVDRLPEAPHFASKIEIQKTIEASGMPFTYLMPNNFYQNDLMFQEPIVGLGVYPQPIGSVGLNRVDIRDIAEAAVGALTRAGHEGKRYPLVGPKAWTGAETAAAWGSALGREVRYAGDDLNAWAVESRKALPDWMVDDMEIMYRFFQEKGLMANEADLALTGELVGHPPRRFEDFVRETAAAWK